jgi:hypothetical protein
VQATPLDHLLADIDRLDFIKMDVEGHEGHALRGMRSLIDKFRPSMVFEFTPQNLRNRGTPPETVLSELEAMNYHFVHCQGAVSGDINHAISSNRMDASSVMANFGNIPSFIDLLALQNN